MNENAECPICFARISTTGDPAANLSLHMSTHSKDEVVAALLGRTRPSQGPNLELISRMPQPVNLSTNVNAFVAGVSNGYVQFFIELVLKQYTLISLQITFQCLFAEYFTAFDILNVICTTTSTATTKWYIHQ